ncbi:MAG: universal stress protein [Polyangiaceae bacterium]
MQTTKTDRFVVVAAIAAAGSTDSSELVVTSAARLAGTITGGELHLVHVLEDIEPPARGDTVNPWSGAEVTETARAYLGQMADLAEKTFSGRVVGHLAVGETWREIVQCAERLSADLVVVGTHGRTGVKRLALGSVSEHVVRMSKCPVLVVRQKNYVSDVPGIEPACADCLVKQRETKGASLWCAHHSKHHLTAHVHYEFPQSFAVGSQLLRP